MNGYRAFITQRPDELDTSNLLTIPKDDYQYINEQISENVNMNIRKIINCNESTNDNNTCTIKHFTVYYKTGLSFNMSNKKNNKLS